MITPEQAFSKYWEQRGVDFHGISIAKDAFLAGRQYQELHQIGILADIRKAVGDPEGRLMWEELVKEIQRIKGEVGALKALLKAKSRPVLATALEAEEAKLDHLP